VSQQYKVAVSHVVRRLPGGGQRQTSAIYLQEEKPATKPKPTK